MIDKEFLSARMSESGFPFEEETLEKFDTYASLLTEWNEKINLTAITSPDGIAVKHFIDSLLLLSAYPVPDGAKLIDVGTGAGFPSVPVAIVRSDIHLTLIDSLNKRVKFLDELTKTLGINADCVHARAEDAGRDNGFRGKYDISCARAVAHLRELAEYCLPFVKVGGVFVALKGSDAETELNEAGFAIKTLGGRVESVKNFDLPKLLDGSEGGKRAIIVIRKEHPTIARYPRQAAKMKKEPLIG